MMRFFGTVRDAIGSMRYGTKGQVALYWFIRVALIAIPILLVLLVAGLIYANVNDIEIQF